VVKAGLADAVATEDFDSLAFGAPKTIRFLHQAAAAPNVRAIQEVDLAAVLSSLSFNMLEFVDLCILCGCDYLGTIQRVGVQTAHKLMNEHRSIEAILGKLDRVKHPVPDSWDFASVRRWFQEPNVGDLGSLDLSFKPPQVQLLRDLLATKHGLPGTFVDE